MYVLLSWIGVWVILGILMKEFGGSDSVKDGMAKVCKAISDFWREGSSFPTNISRGVDDYILAGLTQKLAPHFEVLILENAWENADILSVVYRQTGCSTTLDIIELIFRNFLKNYFNLPANAPLHVFVHIDEYRMYLSYAYTDRGRQAIQEQRNNRRSRQISSTEDLDE